ncbi:MAG TPA: hypothetical protein VGF17_30225, partial [Phytomonospora sp.]
MRAAENKAVMELASAVNHARAARGRVERERSRVGLTRDRAVDLAEALDTLADLADGLSRALVRDRRRATGLIRPTRAPGAEEGVLDAVLYGGAETPVRPRHETPLAALISGAAGHAVAGAAIV